MAHGYVAQNIKHMNRKYVFKVIRKNRSVTRSELGQITGISAPTMLKIFDYFLEIGLILERGELDAPLGRKANLYCFNADSFFSIGVDFSSEHITLGLVNLDNEVVRIKTVLAKGSFIDVFNGRLCDALSAFIEECDIDSDKILGVGVGCPTTVDGRNRILFGPLAGVNEPIDMTKKLESMQKVLGMPIFLENDTNAAAKGEYVSRKLSEKSSIVFISLKEGLGAGLVLNGKIWHGNSHLAGEIGYITFSDDYEADITKAGWMEQELSNEIRGEDIAIDSDVVTICRTVSDDKRQKIVERIAGSVALIISNISAVLDIDNFVVGGDVSQALADEFIVAVRNKVDKIAISDVKIGGETCVNPVIVGMSEIVCEKQLGVIVGR